MENLSAEVERFLDLCGACKATYNGYYEAVGICDKTTIDYLHALELGAFTYRERAKLATAERKNRLERRAAKDMVECYEPLVKWLEAPETVRAVNLLKQALGEIRKAERYHGNRSYLKRVK